MTTTPETPRRPQALLDVSPIDTLASWLAEDPDGIVGAVTSNGTPTAIPADIAIGPEHQIDSRSLLELVVPEDTKAVADAFISAVSHGIGVTLIHMASDPSRPLLLRYVDVRETHGVLIRLVASRGSQPTGAFRVSDLAPARPRLGVMTKDEVAKVLSIDAALSLMLGWSEADMVGRQNLEFIHPEDHVRAIDNWMSSKTADHVSSVQTVRLRYLCKDGSWAWVETSNESHTEADGTTVVTTRFFDVSEEMAASEALRHSESFLRRLTETVPVGLFHIAADGTIAFVNPVLQSLFGAREVGSLADLTDALLSGHGELLLAAIEEVMADGIDADLDVSLSDDDERAPAVCRVNLRAITDGATVIGVLGCVVDVTELREMADTDVLTGLQNRRSIMEMLESHLVNHHGSVAAIYLDLDHFKPVNDRHGHHVGDQLLQAVADRLRDHIRGTDRVGRHGGDEFLVVCPGIEDAAAALGLARRVQRAFDTPFSLSGITIEMCASVGVAVGSPSITADELVACADRAMYDAKRTAGGPPVFRELVDVG